MYDFSDYDLPQNFTWNIKVVQSDGQYAWGDQNRNLRVLLVNQSPEISNPSPLDGAGNIPLSFSMLEVDINDPEGDLINWSIQTVPDIGNNSGINDVSGIKSCIISGLQIELRIISRVLKE